MRRRPGSAETLTPSTEGGGPYTYKEQLGAVTSKAGFFLCEATLQLPSLPLSEAAVEGGSSSSATAALSSPMFSMRTVDSLQLSSSAGTSCTYAHWLSRDACIVAASDGMLSSITLREGEGMELERRWSAHQYSRTAPAEVWVVEGNHWDSAGAGSAGATASSGGAGGWGGAGSGSRANVVWSGGDDAALKGWDLR